MKVSVTLDDRLMERIDKFADENYMSRSGLMSLACAQYLDQYECVSSIRTMGAAFMKIADSGNVDDEVMAFLYDASAKIKAFTSLYEKD